MQAKIEQELEIIKEGILQVVPAEAIYLFGSYAYGTPLADSDLDIYVVVPDDTEDLIEKNGDIRLKLWEKKKRPLDILIGRSGNFNKRKHMPTLERIIARDGRIIYGS